MVQKYLLIFYLVFLAVIHLFKLQDQESIICKILLWKRERKTSHKSPQVMSSFFKSNSPGVCINEVLYMLYGFPYYKAIIKFSFVIDPKQSKLRAASCVLILSCVSRWKSSCLEKNSRLKNCSSLGFLFAILSGMMAIHQIFSKNSGVSNSNPVRYPNTVWCQLK
jgi:hypothetical protein